MFTPRKIVFLLCCAVFGSAAIDHLLPWREATAAQPNPRIIRVVQSSGPIGGTVSVPIELASQGDENAVGFSLTFDAAVLSNPQVALGSDAAGATINSNPGQAAQGRVGIALALPANQKFAAGARQIAAVTFTISANANFGTTLIGFGDQPVLREVADIGANAMSATYTGGAVTITKGFEADVTPRPDGDNNGTVGITDWVQLGRFVAGLDTASDGNEFQRADCAPRNSLGDGRISIIDWTQAGRYAAALDPATAAGGPTSASQAALARFAVGATSRPAAIIGSLQPAIRAPLSGQIRQLTVEINAQGKENALGFSLTFNASQWRFVGATAGRHTREAAFQINANHADRGRVGFVLAMPAGHTIQPGARQLVICSFTPVAKDKSSPLAIGFGDAPVAREVADVEANPVSANFVLEGSDAPVLVSVSAASFVGDEFAPEQIVAAFAENLATGTETATATPLPTALAGTTVNITDSSGVKHQAPLFFVSPGQINYMLPADIAQGLATVTVSNNYSDVAVGTIRISAVAPGIFSANSDGQGVAAAVALRVKPDGSRQFESVSQFDNAQGRFTGRPLSLASKNEQLYLILFGTGLGRTNDTSSVRAQVGGMEATVVYAGKQGRMSGLDQINLLLPNSPRGSVEVELLLTAAGRKANCVKLHIQ